MKRKPFIGGNWKMNSSLKENELLIQSLKKNLQNNKNEIVVFPSAVYLPQIQALLKDSNIYCGAQNMSQHDKGAYTGEISPLMLKDLKINYVLIGHSERRQYFKETNALIAEKVAAALKHNINPVLCIGETLEERKSNQTNQVLLDQLNPVIQKIGIENFRLCVIAYEPVWAIGTGLTATKEQAEEAHAFIRQELQKHSVDVANKIRIIYGGSLKASNANEILSQSDVDGGLIGGASLIAEDFTVICNAIE